MRVDAHQHFWDLDRGSYPWLDPDDHAPIYENFYPEHLKPQLHQAGIEQTVLVQAANSHEDTAAMLAYAKRFDWIGAVIGWVPLLEPELANQALDRYTAEPGFRGVRHLIHDEPDKDWIIREPVLESIELLEKRGLILELPAVFPRHLEHVPKLCETFPSLTLVIDHLAKPPVDDADAFGPWAEELKVCASYENVSAKVSGLNTVSPQDWSHRDIRPYIDVAIDAFGPDRLMFGSDWPVCLLQDPYQKVWQETQRALEHCAPEQLDAVLGTTAETTYRLEKQRAPDSRSV
jgi:L-fuconolactonase